MTQHAASDRARREFEQVFGPLRRGRALWLLSLAGAIACIEKFTGTQEPGVAAGGSASEGGSGDGEAGSPAHGGVGAGAGDGGAPELGGAAGAGEGGAAGERGEGSCGRAGQSCESLPEQCGPAGDRACCSSALVPEGSFLRSHEAQHPATVSAFRLDTYEITVGRFRRFVEAYPASAPHAGCGANPAHAADGGWEPEWSSLLPVTRSELEAALGCESGATWTAQAGSGEDRPITCLTWYEAYAFCIWDGGRLPTEAEWNHAAAGGAEQREYPWSGGAAETTIDATYAVYCGGQACVPERAGSRSPQGDGRFGQADLAGNAREWVQDVYGSYPVPCADCALLEGGTTRVQRGGSYADSPPFLLTSYRKGDAAPGERSAGTGARCARAP